MIRCIERNSLAHTATMRARLELAALETLMVAAIVAFGLSLLL